MSRPSIASLFDMCFNHKTKLKQVNIMLNVNEKLMNLKASVFDNSENVKAYSVRLPLTLSANVDGIATYSGKSRNLILIDLVNLGLAYFIENLSETEKFELGEAIDQAEKELFAQYLEGQK